MNRTLPRTEVQEAWSTSLGCSTIPSTKCTHRQRSASTELVKLPSSLQRTGCHSDSVLVPCSLIELNVSCICSQRARRASYHQAPKLDKDLRTNFNVKERPGMVTHACNLSPEAGLQVQDLPRLHREMFLR